MPSGGSQEGLLCPLGGLRRVRYALRRVLEGSDMPSGGSQEGLLCPQEGLRGIWYALRRVSGGSAMPSGGSGMPSGRFQEGLYIYI